MEEKLSNTSGEIEGQLAVSSVSGSTVEFGMSKYSYKVEKPFLDSCKFSKFGFAQSKLTGTHVHSEEVRAQKKGFT